MILSHACLPGPAIVHGAQGGSRTHKTPALNRGPIPIRLLGQKEGERKDFLSPFDINIITEFLFNVKY